jgi:transcriptional regulator with XRE-family HTH domain
MNRLKEIRENKDLTKTEVAKILNMSQTGYSKYEVETNDIPTEVLKKLARFYNTSIDYLLYMTDNRNPYEKSLVEKEK